MAKTNFDELDLITPLAAAEMAAATATAQGAVELATDAEAITGTATNRALTPANLAAAATTHVAAASETAAGKVELATDAEAKIATDTGRAVTPANLAAALINCELISFDGRNGAGACTAVGAAVGDRVIGVVGLTGGALGAADASFETAITVVDQIQQSAVGNLSANDYLVMLLPVS